jgi:hypothetical protein
MFTKNSYKVNVPLCFIWATRILDPALDGGEWSASRSGRFTPRESAHYIGGWVDLRSSLDAVMKRKIPNPCRRTKTRASSPVGQRYTTELSRLPAQSTYVMKIK